MARARLLKPGFFSNEYLPEVSMAGRLMYAGLWTIADREGRLEDRPKKIKGELFRFDDVDVDELLEELREMGFIERYQVDGKGYIAIPTFLAHQHPHRNEPESVIPPPDSGNGSTDSRHVASAREMDRIAPAESETESVTDPESESETFGAPTRAELPPAVRELRDELVGLLPQRFQRDPELFQEMEDLAVDFALDPEVPRLHARAIKRSGELPFPSKIRQRITEARHGQRENQRRRPGAVEVSDGSDWRAVERGELRFG